MKLRTMIAVTATAGFSLFGTACSRSQQSPETTPLPGSSTQSTNSGTSTDKTNTNTSTQQNGSAETGAQTETGNEQSSGSVANPGTVSPAASAAADESGSTTATASRASKTCLDELQGRFGPDIVFPAQQLFPKQYEQARAQGAGAAAALKQTLSGATCSELKANE